MKKTILFAALLASTATFAIAQDDGPQSEEPKNVFPPQENAPRFGGPAPMFGDAFKDGKIEIAKLPEQTPQEHKDKMKAADKNGDGFIEGDEWKALFPPHKNGPGFGPGPMFGGPGFGPGPQGPGFGAPGFGSGPQGPRFGAPMFGDAFKDGKIEIAKLPEQMSQERKDKMTAADKDGDGFLTRDEMKELAPKFEKPAFMTDDQKIDVAKLTEAIKAADKNGDGFIDQDERKNAFEEAQKKFGPLFFARFAPAPVPFPQWGAPQPWGAWPQGDWQRGPRREGAWPKADWQRGPRREGDWPKADWNRGPRRDGDRPQGDWQRGPRREGDRPRADWNRGPRREGDWPRADLNRGPRREGDRPQGDQPKPEAPKAE
ncbi:MAG: hypothetical protein IJO40_16040 [Thermoguttaceae bacterium]|nr:hypothetical protein [Thermoguttaceae bacterium]